MTYDPFYQPFPEAELIALAEFHESVAKSYPERGYLAGVHLDRAGVCRAALASFNALRERMQLAEMNLGQATAKLRSLEVAA
jgi:hypothetical protein